MIENKQYDRFEYVLERKRKDRLKWCNWELKRLWHNHERKRVGLSPILPRCKNPYGVEE